MASISQSFDASKQRRKSSEDTSIYLSILSEKNPKWKLKTWDGVDLSLKLLFKGTQERYVANMECYKDAGEIQRVSIMRISKEKVVDIKSNLKVTVEKIKNMTLMLVCKGALSTEVELPVRLPIKFEAGRLYDLSLEDGTSAIIEKSIDCTNVEIYIHRCTLGQGFYDLWKPDITSTVGAFMEELSSQGINYTLSISSQQCIPPLQKAMQRIPNRRILKLAKDFTAIDKSSVHASQSTKKEQKKKILIQLVNEIPGRHLASAMRRILMSKIERKQPERLQSIVKNLAETFAQKIKKSCQSSFDQNNLESKSDD